MVKFESYKIAEMSNFIWDGFTDPVAVGVNMSDILDGAAVAGVKLTSEQKGSILIDWKIKLSSGRPILARKYVYAREEYVNCWSSRLVLILTDSKKEFLNFVKSRFEQDDNLDELDFKDFCFESGLEN